MNTTPLFVGLTREVTFAGLPMLHVVLLTMVAMMPIIRGNFLYAIIIFAIGYPPLRALSAYDPKIVNVWITAIERTAFRFDALSERGMTYRA